MNARTIQLALAAVLALAACGKKSETVSFKTEGGKVNVTAGDSVALPADFPKDVPVMPGAVVKAVMGSTAQGNLIVMMNTQTPLADVSAFYEQNLKAQGWTRQTNMNTGEGSLSTHKKEGRDLLLTLAKDSTGTNVQISLPHKG